MSSTHLWPQYHCPPLLLLSQTEDEKNSFWPNGHPQPLKLKVNHLILTKATPPVHKAVFLSEQMLHFER